jgi:hypothetical protein
MAQNSNKAWHLLKKLNSEKNNGFVYTNVTANEVAHQLLLNGKTKRTVKESKKIKRNPCDEINTFTSELDIKEVEITIKSLKNKKTAGVDDILNE